MENASRKIPIQMLFHFMDYYSTVWINVRAVCARARMATPNEARTVNFIYHVWTWTRVWNTARLRHGKLSSSALVRRKLVPSDRATISISDLLFTVVRRARAHGLRRTDTQKERERGVLLEKIAAIQSP